MLPFAAVEGCVEPGVADCSDNFHPHVMAAYESPAAMSIISRESWLVVTTVFILTCCEYGSVGLVAGIMAAYLDKIDQNEFRISKKDFNMLEYSLPYRVPL